MNHVEQITDSALGSERAPAATQAAAENTAAIYTNDSLVNENRNPAIPFPNLVFPGRSHSGGGGAEFRMDIEIAATRNNELLSGEQSIILSYDEDELPELSSAEYIPEKDGETMRFVPSSCSSTTRAQISFAVGEDYEARYQEDRELTHKLIEWQADWNGGMRNLAESTTSRQRKLLVRFFDEPLIEDPVLGLRPPTARELLQPDVGRVLVLHARRALEESFPEGVVIDFLNAIRRFGRFVCEDGAALPSGENVRKRWGQLVCPIGDRDIPKRKSKSDIFLPRIEQMPRLYEAILDWPDRQRKRMTSWRTASLTISCFESGMRGVEARRASLANQVFDRSLGVAGLPNPLAIESAKGGADRLVLFNNFGFDVLRFWLEHYRPRLIDDNLTGPFFPVANKTEKRIASSSLSETTKRLLDHLKGVGLLHESFTFHGTRKTYTTHFLEEHGTDVSWLLDQCGWTSPAQLPVYVRPSVDSIAVQRSQFARTLGRRSGRR